MMRSKRPLRTEAICASIAAVFLLGLTICAVAQPSTSTPPSAGAITTGDGERVLRSAATRPGMAEAPEVVGVVEPAEKPLATRPGYKGDKADKADKGDKGDKGTLDIKGDPSGSIESFSVQNQDVRQSLRLLGFKY